MDARRIALIKPSALGDVVHALPVLTALRIRFPAARITWVINSAYESLIRNHPDLSDTLPFDRGAFRRACSAPRAMPFRSPASCAVATSISSLISRVFSAPASCASPPAPAIASASPTLAKAAALPTPSASTSPTPSASTPWTATGAWPRRSARAMCPKRFHVPLDPSELTAARDEMAKLPRPWIAVAVGAKWTTKRWPPAHFAELLNRAWVRAGGTCFVVGAGRGRRRRARGDRPA